MHVPLERVVQFRVNDETRTITLVYKKFPSDVEPVYEFNCLLEIIVKGDEKGLYHLLVGGDVHHYTTQMVERNIEEEITNFVGYLLKWSIENYYPLWLRKEGISLPLKVEVEKIEVTDGPHEEVSTKYRGEEGVVLLYGFQATYRLHVKLWLVGVDEKDAFLHGIVLALLVERNTPRRILPDFGDMFDRNLQTYWVMKLEEKMNEVFSPVLSDLRKEFGEGRVRLRVSFDVHFAHFFLLSPQDKIFVAREVPLTLFNKWKEIRESEGVRRAVEVLFSWAALGSVEYQGDISDLAGFVRLSFLSES